MGIINKKKIQLTRTGQKALRKKRGLFNFNGQLSHSLSGILDSDSEVFFNDKISRLGEQTDLIKPAREQIVVVKATLDII
jgi:hypothetical protein